MGDKSEIQWTGATKTCTGPCGLDKPRSEFATDRRRADGLTYWCRSCRNARSRRMYVSRASGAPKGPRPIAPRDGDARQARRRINVLVRTGRLPRPNDLLCVDCGHAWREGERRHEYDHYLGYGAAHHLDVEPVCSRCHHIREASRG